MVSKSVGRTNFLSRDRSVWFSGIAGACLAIAVVLATPNGTASAATDVAAGEPATSGGPPAFRRLGEAQYVRSIEQIFGSGIKVPGRFEPSLRNSGLLAIGDGKVAVTPSGMEQYELRAREIAAQVLSEESRKTLLSCTPHSAQAFDRACATAFLGTYGRLLYRRPLTDKEMTSVLSLSSAATAKSQNFYKGLEIGLSRLLASPKFIFRVETGGPDTRNRDPRRLDDFSLAGRLSFLLWDAPPDGNLLDAAARGDLRDSAKLEAQVDRMIRSPRFVQGVRSFFSDMLGYDQFNGLTKDQSIYPKYTSDLMRDAQEQTLLTIVSHLVQDKGDYRDLFTTKKTFMNRNVGGLYKVPVDEGGLKGWVPYTFAPNDPRGGILTLAAFLMLDPTHEGRSSPTIRGKAVRELMLCQRVPDPPPNVNFALVSDTSSVLHKTARQRLTMHQENPACVGCHSITDPIGLSLENYDAIGAFRTQENGAPIDASGKFEGKSYKDALGLSQLLRESPTITDCATQRVFEYGVGRATNDGEQAWLEHATKAFAADGYRFPDLMRRIALSTAFRTVSKENAAPPKLAALSSPRSNSSRR